MGQWLLHRSLSQGLLARAIDILDTGEQPTVSVTAKERRELERSVRELEKDWRAGKSLQRKQQLQLMPKSWQSVHRIPIGYFPALKSPTDVVIGEWPGQKNSFEIVAGALAAQLPTLRLDVAQSVTDAAVWQLLVNTINPFTVSIFVYQHACAFGPPNVFQVQASLVEKLLVTDASGVTPSDVRPPFPGFYVSMPPGSLSIWNDKTGHHQVSLLGVAEGDPESIETTNERTGQRGSFGGGRTLFSVFFGEPNERSASAGDDNITNTALPLGEQYKTFEEASAAFGESLIDRPDFLRFMGKSYSAHEGMRMLDHFVANFCLYLSSPNPDIMPVRGGQRSWSAETELVEGRRTAPHLRLLKEPPIAALWDVGRNTSRLHKTQPSDILVRGHWRRQAHGPGRLQRKVIWIEPFIRNATGGGAPGHDYEANPATID